MVAGLEESGIIVGSADGNVADTVDDLVIVEDVVCCNECRYWQREPALPRPPWISCGRSTYG